MVWKGPLEPWLWHAVMTAQEGLKREPYVLKRIGRKAVCSGAWSIRVHALWNESLDFQPLLRPSVQFSSVTQSCPTLCDPMNRSTPGLPITNSQSPPKPMSIESVMPSSHLILCHPLLLLPSIFPSIRVFSNESALCIRWTKYWSFSFNISPSNEHPGLIFRMDWLDLLAVQGTLKSLLQHHSSKASILQCSAFFIVQLSHPYVTTGNRWLKGHTTSQTTTSVW